MDATAVGVEHLTAQSIFFIPFVIINSIFLYQTNVFILYTVSFLFFDIIYIKDKVRRFTTSKNHNRGNSRHMMNWWIPQLEELQKSSLTRPC